MPMVSAYIHRKNVFIILSTAAALLFATIAVILYVGIPKSGPVPTNFEECAALYGFSGVLPKTCTVPWGRTFALYEDNFPSVNNEIRTDLPPAPVLSVSSLSVTGAAHDDWFDGGTFIIDLLDEKGEVLSAAKARRIDGREPPPPPGWSFYEATLSFEAPIGGGEASPGALVFKKSGGAAALITPVYFSIIALP